MTLRSLGHTVEEGKAPYDPAEIDELWAVLTGAGLARVGAGHSGWRERIDPASAATAERGAKLTAVQYVQTLDKVSYLRKRVAQEFCEFDVLVTPTSGAHPWSIGVPYPKEIDGRPAGPRTSAVFTTFVNASALPAMNVPIGSSASGMPMGMQLVTAHGSDDTLMALASEFETAQPWVMHWPKLALD